MELLDVVDEHGEPTGRTVEREKAHREGIMHRTSHVWLIRRTGSGAEILLQKRCMQKDSFPGCYDISSAGHIPAGVSFADSAVRELKEELGITAEPKELIFCGDRTLSVDSMFHGTPFHDRQYSRVFLLLNDTDAKDFMIQKEEIDEVLWMDLEECMAAVRDNRIRHCIFLNELEMVKATWNKLQE